MSTISQLVRKGRGRRVYKSKTGALGRGFNTLEKAIEYLCEPDPQSRSDAFEGRRLVKEGQFAYHVPSHERYRAIQHEGDRREYLRKKKRESRARNAVSPVESTTYEDSVSTPVNTCQHSMSTLSTHTETETESEVSLLVLESSSLRSEDSKTNNSSSEDARPYTPLDLSQEQEPPSAAGDRGKSPEPEARAPRLAARAAGARTVFDAWRLILSHPSAVFDDKRKSLIESRLKNFTVEQLCKVPLGVKQSPWHMGENPLKKPYHEINLLFRDADKVEFFLALAEQADDVSEQSVSDRSAVIAAQEACGCYDMGGLRKVERNGKSVYITCDHAQADIVIPISEAPKPVWPPPPPA